MNPQAAADLANGFGRVRPFMEQIQPAQVRAMPTVAGRNAVDAMRAPAQMPMMAGPAQTQLSQLANMQAQASSVPGVQLNGSVGCPGCVRGVGAITKPGTWPTWVKVTLALALVAGGGALIWTAYKRRAPSFEGIDY